MYDEPNDQAHSLLKSPGFTITAVMTPRSLLMQGLQLRPNKQPTPCFRGTLLRPPGRIARPPAEDCVLADKQTPWSCLLGHYIGRFQIPVRHSRSLQPAAQPWLSDELMTLMTPLTAFAPQTEPLGPRMTAPRPFGAGPYYRAWSAGPPLKVSNPGPMIPAGTCCPPRNPSRVSAKSLDFSCCLATNS
jgi:hypothetical protein